MNLILMYTCLHYCLCSKGVNVWRDVQLPVDILKEWCRVKYGVDETPRWLGTKEVIVGPKRYNLRTFG